LQRTELKRVHGESTLLGQWGFLPEWAAGKPDVKPLINARAETAASKPFFRQAFRSKRCLVLADGFYEWKRTGKRKMPYRIALKINEPFAFAGLWSTVRDAQGRPRTTFAVLTTDANALVARLHPRMPAILRPQDEAIWLDPLLSPEQAQTLLAPYPAGLLHAYPVSAQVNSPAWNHPQALAPLPQDATREPTPDHIADWGYTCNWLKIYGKAVHPIFQSLISRKSLLVDLSFVGMLTSLCGESGLRLSRKWCLETWSQHLQSIEKMGHADQIFPEKHLFG
jgi:putative SOS response-associated peptidase YedK